MISPQPAPQFAQHRVQPLPHGLLAQPTSWPLGPADGSPGPLPSWGRFPAGPGFRCYGWSPHSPDPPAVMSDPLRSLALRCPSCHRLVRAATAMAGRTSDCPQCESPLAVPAVSPEATDTTEEVMDTLTSAQLRAALAE